MKSLLVLPSGLPDAPAPELDGVTPLEAARTPVLDRWAQEGRAGLVRLVPEGLPEGSDVALLSLLGVDPRRENPGRGALEALGLGVELGPEDLALRLSFCSSFRGRLVHPRGGGLRPAEAQALIASLQEQLGDERFSFHPGRGYRALLVAHEAADLEVETTPPAEARAGDLAAHRPRGADVERIAELLDRAEALLSAHDINRVRVDLGETPADRLWAWGPGRARKLMPFALRDGRQLAVVAQTPLVRGIGHALGATVLDLPDAHDELVTAWDAKAQAALDALEEHDVVLLHVAAPSEAGHERNPRLKRDLIQELDRHLLRPLDAALRERGDTRLLFTSDHHASSVEGAPLTGPLPFLAWGPGLSAVRPGRFTEAEAAGADLRVEQGSALLAFLNRSGLPSASAETA